MFLKLKSLVLVLISDWFTLFLFSWSTKLIYLCKDLFKGLNIKITLPDG